MQTKANVGLSNEYVLPSNTHARIFDRPAYYRSEERAQQLRNQDAGGKKYDIITGTAITHYVPSNEERGGQKIREMGHPSQQTLERGWNRQGALSS